MKRYLVLARRSATGRTLQETLTVFLPDAELAQADRTQVPLIVFEETVMAVDQWFDYLAGRLASVFGEGGGLLPVGDCSVVVDEFDLTQANPLKSLTVWDATIAMLILAFPEFQWAFAALTADNTDTRRELKRWHSFRRILEGPYADPLFDGSGLRNEIRCLILGESGSSLAPYVPLRQHLATALEDEVAYAYFNAYTAYRFGYRAFPVCRNNLATDLFKKERPASCAPQLSFEDVFLSYPDGDGNHYSNLSSEDDKGRRKNFPALESVCYRMFVTTDHRHTGDISKHDQNIKYIRSQACVQKCNAPKRYGRKISKPFSGMFDLWTQTGLDRRLRWRNPNTGRLYVGLAEGFIWPPSKNPDRPSKDKPDLGHSAPGRLLQIATHMINRCDASLRTGAHTVQDALRCAVLATDAFELLGDRTPSTAADALALKHTAEVTAECQFSGIEYHLDMQPRLDEIRCEARGLSRWFGRRRQTMAAMNAQMTTLVDLMRVLREHGQFDEVQICHNKVRELHNRLWMLQRPLKRFVYWPVFKYIEIILSSFRCFLAAILGWMLACVALLKYVAKMPVKPALSVGPWEQAFTAFTGFNNFNSNEFTWNVITAFAVVIGIAHIGIFISHVYLLVSRKD